MLYKVKYAGTWKVKGMNAEIGM
uniref:Uncharacterized protein n=1 Tax=Ciona intestinalis TaxID=7719 RepID=H2Y0W4_CIOIN